MKRKRDYCFKISISARDDAMSRPIEMPIFRIPYANLTPEQLPDAFREFLSAIKTPANKKIAKEILRITSEAINEEHLMDLEMKRLKA